MRAGDSGLLRGLPPSRIRLTTAPPADREQRSAGLLAGSIPLDDGSRLLRLVPSRGKGSCSFHEAWAKFGRSNEHFQPRLDSASHRLSVEVSSLNQCKENLVPREHESQYFLPETAHARSRALSSSLPHSWFLPLATVPLCPDESPIWHLWQDGEEVHPHFFRQQGLKFPPNSICIPARDFCLTLPSFPNPPALLSLPNTHRCPASP